MNFSQLRALVVCWIAYASTYFLRKPVGVGKSAIGNALGLSAKSLGLFDTAFLVPYATVQMFFGSVGDFLGPRKTLVVVLLGSGLSMITFGNWSNIEFMCLLLLLNGAFQSLAWGNCVKALSGTFESAQHNKIIGIFSTSSFAGGVMASALSVKLLNIGGWKSMFFLPSAIIIGCGLIVFFCLKDQSKPAAAGSGSLESGRKTGATGANTPLTVRQLLAIRMLPEVTLCFLFVKLVRYAFFMWLPMYLHHALNYDESSAGIVAAMFDVGGVLGSASLGFLIDHVFHGKDVAASAVTLFICTASLILFSLTSDWSKSINCFFILIAGATNCGVDPILSGTLPIKFAAHAQSQGLAHDATSQIAGFINGVASLGSVLEGLLVGVIADAYGWHSVFFCITAMCFVSFFILFRAARTL
eukprot:m.227528 g.227528  ORF g.227528 m.227528 type:complete len:414 (+) comp17240_c0_seq1:96-1337(+)